MLFIAGFGLITLTLGEGAYLYARRQLASQLDANMRVRMESLERGYARDGRKGLIALIDDYTGRGARTFGYILTDPRGVRLRHLVGVPALAPGWSVIALPDHDERAVDPARTLTERLPDGSTLTIVADRDFIEQYDAVTTGFLCAALAVLFLTAAGGALWLERTVRRRITAINETARAIFAGNLDRRVPISVRRDEFDAIATTVNAMLDRMNASLNEVRRVSSYVAHDLRAPLVRLCDHLNRGGPGQTDLEAIEQCENIIRLFGAILRIGQIDSALIAGNATEVDLSALVGELGDAHVAVAEDVGRTLVVDVAPDIRSIGNRDLLAQMLINLIDNALSHTPAGARIEVGLEGTNSGARLTIADNGRGIDVAWRERMNQNEGRPPVASEGRDRLGLKLVRAIVAGHKGTFMLKDNAPGLLVEIELPRGV
ncbi:MAG TPA: HAMP domain-containing sensor histidine kinase [Sphingomonas sp.]|nr:HAMP domain-containing sensor histidine kinase [Sphingomonas sp.]